MKKQDRLLEISKIKRSKSKTTNPNLQGRFVSTGNNSNGYLHLGEKNGSLPYLDKIQRLKSFKTFKCKKGKKTSQVNYSIQNIFRRKNDTIAFPNKNKLSKNSTTNTNRETDLEESVNSGVEPTKDIEIQPPLPLPRSITPIQNQEIKKTIKTQKTFKRKATRKSTKIQKRRSRSKTGTLNEVITPAEGITFKIYTRADVHLRIISQPLEYLDISTTTNDPPQLEDRRVRKPSIRLILNERIKAQKVYKFSVPLFDLNKMNDFIFIFELTQSDNSKTKGILIFHYSHISHFFQKKYISMTPGAPLLNPALPKINLLVQESILWFGKGQSTIF